jgi:hypothetical protein
VAATSPAYHCWQQYAAATVFYLTKLRQDHRFICLTSCGSPGPYETFFSIIKNSALNKSSELKNDKDA